MGTPLEIWFPQIVFTLLTLRSINVEFSDNFFVYQIKVGNAYYQKKMKKIDLTLSLLPKIAFFWGFENDSILSSKPYTVTKSGISPQRKL